MATALELGPEGWTPYLEALKRRPISVPSPQMVAERERLVDDARRVASMLRGKYGATRVVLFGSLAHRAWFHPLTDVDLAVEGIPPSDFYGAWEDADLAIRGRSVDLVALETAPEGIRHALAEDGVEL